MNKVSDNKQHLFLGTELKLNININPIGDITMDDYEFIVEAYCFPKKVLTIHKEEAIRVDENNYIIRVDTLRVGPGNLKCKVTAYIPDGDFDDGLRTEVVVINTDINIAI